MKYENYQALVPHPKADHKAALETAKWASEISDEYQNLAAAYLERDRQVRELRELAKAAINCGYLPFEEWEGSRNALRVALREE